ncbi:LysE family translocator [Streptomyces sp. NPDC059786]|uniref:LysE family translocator n=1 Tax=Streptomyces sp. NPDC059786 TaxID=3346946 RepID=UPI0036656CDB
MDYSWGFLFVVVALVLTPGADFVLIVQSTLSGGRRCGAATAFGVASAAVLQGLLVTAGVASVIVRVQPLFLAIKWVGVAYLAWLGFTSLRSALHGRYGAVGADGASRSSAWAAYRRGVLCDATNPKILVFYLSLLPQFVDQDASWVTWLAHAWTVPCLGITWFLLVVAFVGSVRLWLERRPVRRAFDASAGAALLFFCVSLAGEA